MYYLGETVIKKIVTNKLLEISHLNVNSKCDSEF
jgi:hypothetical protein